MNMEQLIYRDGKFSVLNPLVPKDGTLLNHLRRNAIAEQVKGGHKILLDKLKSGRITKESYHNSLKKLPYVGASVMGWNVNHHLK